MKRLFGLIVFLAFSQAFALTVEQVNKAIKDKGAKWQAQENWVWQLPRSDQKVLLGAQIQPPSMFFTVINEPPRALSVPVRLDWHNYQGVNYHFEIDALPHLTTRYMSIISGSLTNSTKSEKVTPLPSKSNTPSHTTKRGGFPAGAGRVIVIDCFLDFAGAAETGFGLLKSAAG